MSSKEQRSVEQVRQLLSALGFSGARVHPASPPRPDVFAEIGSRRIAIETTDYHGDETSRRGSAVRRDEEQDAREGRTRAHTLPAASLPGLVSRIQAKVKKHYELSPTDEAWLAIFAGVTQPGAAAATLLVTSFIDCEQLTICTAPLLEASVFHRCYIFCKLTEAGQPKLYLWEKGRAWTEVTLPSQATPGPVPTFWDIQKLFGKT
ncbi:hypothetical protein [Ralstonia syzygii]|uniref:Uncharacterized protein n=1 Tax=Ralstonia syzygii R24 TaxID=907261 RepID=G3A1P0_9RALS|nr:hypothetical protein [Ralstonia syzygii]CCA85145.1 conserved hypothetical protein [Ralstonia syzygii R24]